MMKRHEIQVLLKAGLPQAEVARIAGVSEWTMGSIRMEGAVAEVDHGAERRRRRIGRPSRAEPFRSFAAELLGEDPELMSLEILRRVRLAGYTGGKTALYDRVAAVRPTLVRSMVRFEGLPGEFTQHDFGHVDVRFLDGTTRRVIHDTHDCSMPPEAIGISGTLYLYRDRVRIVAQDDGRVRVTGEPTPGQCKILKKLVISPPKQVPKAARTPLGGVNPTPSGSRAVAAVATGWRMRARLRVERRMSNGPVLPARALRVLLP